MIFSVRGMVFWLSLLISAGMLGLAFHYWAQVEAECEAFSRRWFRGWVVRGIVIPIGVWLYLNLGQTPLMPPLLRVIEEMRAYSQWGRAAAAQACVGLMVITIFWAALTFVWFMLGLLSVAKNRDDILLTGLFWSPLSLPVFVGMFFMAGWTGLALGVALGLSAFTHYTIAVIDTRPPEPRYGGAIGKLKMGKYAEAELAIVNELEKCESHFEGWLLLAEVYALHFHDLPEAERTIVELCQQPETGLTEISIALHRLADWQLKVRNDTAAARRALEDICARMPGTHLATMARHRINQLADAQSEPNQKQQPHTIAMPKVIARLDATEERLEAEADREKTLAAADACVERLKRDPNDHASREKLARLFAEQLRQVDLAMEQMELLLEMPEQPPGKTAEWLSLMAQWLIKYRNDQQRGKELLHRIIEEFPRSAEAFEAQRRLSMMDMEERGRRRKEQAGGAAVAAQEG
jgi:hypothetical protein